MKDMSKTKAQLIEELETLRVRNRTLEHSDAVRAQEPGRLELISRAAEQSTEGMAIVDLEGNLIFLNNSFANMHGYDPDELIGKNLSIFHTPDQMPSVNAANRELRETGTFSGEIWHTRRDGTVRIWNPAMSSMRTRRHRSCSYDREARSSVSSMWNSTRCDYSKGRSRRLPGS